MQNVQPQLGEDALEMIPEGVLRNVEIRREPRSPSAEAHVTDVEEGNATRIAKIGRFHQSPQ